MMSDQIARREAFEEIGLPMDDIKFPKPFRVEKLCYLPPALARTHIVVTPCVAFLHADQPRGSSLPSPIVEDTIMPRLDAREVAAVFTAPFYNFLKKEDLPPQPGHQLPPGNWYEGTWIQWKDVPWRAHSFYVPVNNQRVSKPPPTSELAEAAEKVEAHEEDEGRLRVWGMTGRILVDAARLAYNEEPEVEHNDSFGDAEIITRAYEEGAFEQRAKV